jgi:hypothetical protein
LGKETHFREIDLVVDPISFAVFFNDPDWTRWTFPFLFFLTNVHHFEWKKLKNMKGRLLTAKVKRRKV